MTRRFKITKLFIGGLLQGLVTEEFTDANFFIGQKILKPCGGSPYQIIVIERLTKEKVFSL